MIVCTFDTETTGLLKNPMARVIEIGVVRHNLQTGEILETDAFLVKPAEKVLPMQDFGIPERFCGIHKFQILESGINYEDALRRFSSFVGNDLVYAWNLPFDQRMMMRFIEDSVFSGGNTVAAMSWMQKIRWGGCWQYMYAYSNLKAGYTSRFPDGNLKTISMRDTIDIEGWGGEQSHRALDDAKLAAKIGHKMFNKLNS